MSNPANKRGPIAFTRPTVGPKVYVTKGPSGWPETYQRAHADLALAEFINPLSLEELVNNFWTKVDLERTEDSQEETWSQVLVFLAKVTNTANYLQVPEMVAVAFWGKALLIKWTGDTN